MGGFKAFDPRSFNYSLNPVLAGPEGIRNIDARIPLPGVGLFLRLIADGASRDGRLFPDLFLQKNRGRAQQGVTGAAAAVARFPGDLDFNSLPLVALFAMVIALAMIYLYKDSEGARPIGHWLLRGSILFQVVAIALFFYNVKTMTNVGSAGRQRSALSDWL